ncbi:OLC1v1023539C1 [Oldenlandia corymbosa var. corymbosa]|uniref:OLC1v1023539C1 n=1 Tax=Oldenlandia corymbosa var. corymbosa TaxID=529605 RepID=A0AAV1C300_OLDCO|nr:OLC1v1023539C1 [Oldenlandia corymbosa var. corymbosa]
MIRKNKQFSHNVIEEGPPFNCSIFPSVTKCVLHGRESQTLVCDITTLLRSSSNHSFFPYFMLVAFEGGSIFRAFLLLLSFPLLCTLGFDLRMRFMIFITFCGLRLKDMDVVARAVLPKFYLEDLNLRVYEVLDSVGSRLVFTSLPRIMVEGFLKDDLNVEVVQGSELHTIWNGKYFSGFLATSSGQLLLKKDAALRKHFGEKKPDLGIASLTADDLKFISVCKESYVVTEEDRKPSSTTIMPRKKYPKPLIFHDGRLAFFPTPFATLKMFIWLPIGLTLGIIRTLAVLLLPHKMSIFVIKSTGLIFKYKIHHQNNQNNPISPKGKNGGVLYVCNHRTLLDPVFLNLAVQKPLAALTYSLSRFSEVISPIRTVKLKRDRTQDAKTIENLLNEGDLVVCPEGTTCREPYLLRFSSLFAELTDEIVPVAVNTHVTMFYGTTASGFKWLDHIFFAINPRPCYSVEVLVKLPRELTVSGGKSSHEVANYIQSKLADALGFECTNLTRRDKYLMLAGNEGLVNDDNIPRNVFQWKTGRVKK